jgi:AcrR family transcriptional regulator
VRRTAEDAAATRAALLEAALTVFAERGVATATLAEVAARAGLTRGAVYHPFADKSALLAAAVDEPWDALAAPAFAVLDGPHATGRPLRARLGEFTELWLHALRTDQRFLALMTLSLEVGPSLRSDPEARALELSGWLDWRDRLCDVLVAHRDELAPGVDPEAAAGHLLAWLAGTTQLAGTDLSLLPAPSGATPIFTGLLRTAPADAGHDPGTDVITR